MKYKGYKIIRSPSYCVIDPNGAPLPDAQDIEEAKWLINDDLKRGFGAAFERKPRKVSASKGAKAVGEK